MVFTALLPHPVSRGANPAAEEIHMLASQALATIFVIWAVVDYLTHTWSRYIDDARLDAYVSEPIWKTTGAAIFAAVVANGIWGWFS